MLIEQIIEFKLRGPGPLGRYTYIPTTDYFHDKTKSLMADYYKNFSSGFVLLKYCRSQCALLPPSWAKSLTKLTPKCKTLNLFWI